MSESREIRADIVKDLFNNKSIKRETIDELKTILSMLGNIPSKKH